jgi:hypothetical protein
MGQMVDGSSLFTLLKVGDMQWSSITKLHKRHARDLVSTLVGCDKIDLNADVLRD